MPYICTFRRCSIKAAYAIQGVYLHIANIKNKTYSLRYTYRHCNIKTVYTKQGIHLNIETHKYFKKIFEKLKKNISMLKFGKDNNVK